MGAIRKIFVGMQWGDEGKGKLVDEAIQEAKEMGDGRRIVVARFQGGANAGHSIYIRDNEGKINIYIGHCAPIGVKSETDLAIGPHVAFAPDSFIRDMGDIDNYPGRIMISERVGVLFDYHRLIDKSREIMGGSASVGSTMQGIGPFYEDNARRTTRMTFDDYLSSRFPDRLKKIIELKKREIEASGVRNIDDYLQRIVEEHNPLRKKLAGFSERLEYRLQDYMKSGCHILVEGGQGTGLDVDLGTIPDQTASHLTAPAGLASLGLPRNEFKIIGVEKAYPTRVGKGIMPTLDNGEFGRQVAINGGEKGATTGRLRRVGWPDWLMVKRSAMLNDCDEIIITRADVIQGWDIRVCKSYKEIHSGMLINEVPLNLENIIPNYGEEFYNWNLWDGFSDLSEPAKVDSMLVEKRTNYVNGGFFSLPLGLREYKKDHDCFVGCKTSGISIGPARGETVYFK